MKCFFSTMITVIKLDRNPNYDLSRTKTCRSVTLDQAKGDEASHIWLILPDTMA